MPVHHAEQSVNANLTARRAIEDRLIHYGLCMDYPLSMHFKKMDRHASDRRKGMSMAYLCVSNTFKESSPWCANEVLVDSDGTIEGIPLAKVSDLRTKVVSRVGPASCGADAKLQPAERATQRGPQAAEFILSKLARGMRLTSNDTLIVVDENTGVGDWADGVFRMDESFRRGASDAIHTVYLGACVCPANQESLEHEELHARMQGKLLSTWWEDQAGPKEPTTTLEEFVPKPMLTLLTWGPNGAQIPEIIMNRFGLDSPMHSHWVDFCKLKVQELSLAQASRMVVASDNRIDRGQAAGENVLTGPDISVDPPINLGARLTPESVSSGDFPSRNTFLAFD
jgi:hypothetical protein